MMSDKSTRYLPKHAWYLADAQLLVRTLQAVLWPVGWHVSLGGGVLNHGYSDKDLDLYVLPIYRPANLPDAFEARLLLGEVFKGSEGYVLASSLDGLPEHECYAHSVSFEWGSKRVDVFVVRP